MNGEFMEQKTERMKKIDTRITLLMPTIYRLKIQSIVFFIFCQLICTGVLTAQKKTTDSLALAFNAADSDTARLNMLLKSNPSFYFTQPDLSLELLNKGLVIAERTGDIPKSVRLTILMANVQMYAKSNEGEAFKLFQKALEKGVKADLYADCAMTTYAMGIISHHQGFRDKMFAYFEQSVDYADKSDMPYSNSILALMGCYAEDKRFDEASKIIEKCIQMVQKGKLTHMDQFKVYGVTVQVLKQMPKAYQEKNYAILREKFLSSLKVVDFKDKPELLNAAAEICMAIQEPDLAIKYAQQTLALTETDAVTLGSKALAHRYLAEAYQQFKNYPLSNEHWQLYAEQLIATRTKEMTEDAGRKVIKAEGERDLLIKQNEIDKHKLLAMAGFTIAALVLLGGIVGYRFYKREQERKEELAELNKTKDRLLSIIAHDLRSPIGLLKDSFERMDNGIQSLEQTARFLAKSRERIDRVYNTMENLLVWALAQYHGLNPKFESVSLADSVAEQIEAVHDFAAQKGISIENDTPQYLKVWVDKNQLAIVINNLLQNALKFTPSGGSITLSAEETGDKNITFKVIDTGVGMDTVVWKQQQQAQTLLSKEGTAKEKGTGLGLFLVKEIVDKNGGTLHIQSEKGTGTTVSIGLQQKV